jgi:hypothetical protein
MSSITDPQRLVELVAHRIAHQAAGERAPRAEAAYRRPRREGAPGLPPRQRARGAGGRPARTAPTVR